MERVFASVFLVFYDATIKLVTFFFTISYKN